MNRKQKFINFMESMKTVDNAMLLEAIKAGFNATSLFEASAGEDWNNPDEDSIPSDYTDDESVGEITRHYQITYDITTDESADHGDYAEAGWADARGNRFANDPETGVQEAPEAEEVTAEPEFIVDEMVRVLRNAGANENNGNGTAYRTSDADINAISGEHTYKTYHLIDFTPEEIDAIELKLNSR